MQQHHSLLGSIIVQMLFFNFWYCGDLNNGGDWFHLTDPYLFKIHWIQAIALCSSIYQWQVPMKRILNVIVPVLLAQFFNAWFCYISVNKRYICTSNRPVVFPGNHDQGCLWYYNRVRILCKFFQCSSNCASSSNCLSSLKIFRGPV